MGAKGIQHIRTQEGNLLELNSDDLVDGLGLDIPDEGGPGGPTIAADVSLDPTVSGQEDVQAALGEHETRIGALDDIGGNIPTSDQKEALDNALNALNEDNPVVDLASLVNARLLDVTNGSSQGLNFLYAGRTLYVTGADPLTITIPTDDDLEFPIGTEIYILQAGTGQITVEGALGVTLRSPEGQLATAGQWAMLALTKFGPDEWVVSAAPETELPIAISDVTDLDEALADKLESPIEISDVTNLSTLLPSIDQKAALAGGAIEPDAGNVFVTVADLPLRTVTVDLTPAQIDLLLTTPVEILPAPGEAKAIVPVDGFVEYWAGAAAAGGPYAAFTNPTGLGIALAGPVLVLSSPSIAFDQPVHRVAALHRDTGYGASAPQYDFENKALNVSADDFDPTLLPGGVIAASTLIAGGLHWAAGDLFTVVPNGGEAGGEGEVATVAQSFLIIGVNTGTKTFTVAGDATPWDTGGGHRAEVFRSTANDAAYTVVSATFVTDHTDIVVTEVIPDGTVDGFLGDMDGVSGVGEILTYTITAGGSGYIVDDYTCSADGPGGTGLGIHVDSFTVPVSLRVVVKYYIVDLLGHDEEIV